MILDGVNYIVSCLCWKRTSTLNSYTEFCGIHSIFKNLTPNCTFIQCPGLISCAIFSHSWRQCIIIVILWCFGVAHAGIWHPKCVLDLSNVFFQYQALQCSHVYNAGHTWWGILFGHNRSSSEGLVLWLQHLFLRHWYTFWRVLEESCQSVDQNFKVTQLMSFKRVRILQQVWPAFNFLLPYMDFGCKNWIWIWICIWNSNSKFMYSCWIIIEEDNLNSHSF